MKADEPAYPRDIVAMELRKKILRGEYREDRKLPSPTDFARESGVSRGTVETAYAILINEGLVVAGPGRGYFVAHKGDHENLRRDFLKATIAHLFRRNRNVGYKRHEIADAMRRAADELK